MIVEVEAYGGPPTARGQTPRHTPSADDAGATPSCSDRRAGCTPTAATAFTSAPTWSAATTVSPARCCCGPRRSSPDSRSRVTAAATRYARRRWPAGRATSARRWESRWTTTESTSSIPSSPVQLRLAVGAHRGRRAARGRQPGRRPAVAVLAGGTPGGFAVPPQSAGTGARSKRLIREDRRHGNVEHPRRVGLARADRAVHRPGCAGGPAGRGTCHRLFGIRPDRAEPARRPSGPAADAASLPAGRPPADRAGRRRNRNDRRSQGDRRTHPATPRPPLPTGPTASAVSSNASSTSTTRRPAPSSRTT